MKHEMKCDVVEVSSFRLVAPLYRILFLAFSLFILKVSNTGASCSLGFTVLALSSGTLILYLKNRNTVNVEIFRAVHIFAYFAQGSRCAKKNIM